MSSELVAIVLYLAFRIHSWYHTLGFFLYRCLVATVNGNATDTEKTFRVSQCNAAVFMFLSSIVFQIWFFLIRTLWSLCISHHWWSLQKSVLSWYPLKELCKVITIVYITHQYDTFFLSWQHLQRVFYVAFTWRFYLASQKLISFSMFKLLFFFFCY